MHTCQVLHFPPKDYDFTRKIKTVPIGEQTIWFSVYINSQFFLPCDFHFFLGKIYFYKFGSNWSFQIHDIILYLVRCNICELDVWIISHK